MNLLRSFFEAHACCPAGKVPEGITFPQGMCSGEPDEENPVRFKRKDSPYYGAMQYQLNYRLLSVIN
jgi:hypothetical protein